MFHLTLFAGTEGEIPPAGFTAFTAFGGAELRRPTLASQLLHLKNRGHRRPSRLARLLGTDKNLIMTVFGGTVLLAPTLIEEYSALQGLLRSGTVSGDECTALLDRLAADDGDPSLCRTVTLFGACVTRHPSAAKERKALEAATKAGAVTNAIRRALDEIVGSPPAARVRALGHLVATT
jgi:hypothetical protein